MKNGPEQLWLSLQVLAGQKSMALSFTVQNREKTLTDKDIDEMMQKIIVPFEKELNAEIRKS